MSKENAKIVTFDQLIQRKSQKEEFQQRTTEIYSEELDASLVIHRPTDSQLLEAIEYFMDKNDMPKMVEGMKRLIYRCCDALQDRKLHEALGIVDPFDTVCALFTPTEIIQLGSQIAEFCGLFQKTEKDIEAVKN